MKTLNQGESGKLARDLYRTDLERHLWVWRRERGSMRRRASTFVVMLAALALLAGCDQATGPGAGANSVGLSFTLAGGAANPAPGLFAASLDLNDGSNTLSIQSAEIVLREIEFERLESTVDCDQAVEPDDCQEFEVGPVLVALPLDGSVNKEITAEVEPGTYDEIEFELHKVEDSDIDFLTAHPNFADISIRVSGTFNGQDFLYTSRLNEEQEFQLADPLVVGADSGPTNVTLSIDVSTWFVTAGGALVDPRTAVDGEPNESLVTDNIRASIDSFRDDDEDGVPHGEDTDEN